MSDYIEREAALAYPIRKDKCDRKHANKHFIFGIESVIEFVENLPAADVAPVRRGRMTRESILNRAIECVCGERERDYGTPEDNFNRIATYWSAHLGMEITAEDVAVMMALLKIARIGTGTATDDSWIDLAVYAACGGEIAAKGRKHG